MAFPWPLSFSVQLLFVYTFSLHALSATVTQRVGPTGNRVITVDVNGGGNFRSVQAAVDAVPDNNRVNVTIQISAGYYIEKVVVPATKPYITFQGAGREKTVIEWHDRASDLGPSGQQLRTYRTASVTVFANFFSARNISFKNTAPAPMPGMEGWQAASLGYQGTKRTCWDV
ncbi:probable pectinesterase 68, partial [Prosopis cineraria]|uniref:probable pectinesterase 68 n=1 Tax=Prosopis cineraria TaxID=364024 RepID=UPI00241045AC